MMDPKMIINHLYVDGFNPSHKNGKSFVGCWILPAEAQWHRLWSQACDLDHLIPMLQRGFSGRRKKKRHIEMEKRERQGRQEVDP